MMMDLRDVKFRIKLPLVRACQARFGKVSWTLGRKHGQESVITKDKDKAARLHDTESKKRVSQ